MAASASAAGSVVSSMTSSRHIVTISFILLLHVLFFYALQAGLLREASKTIEREVIARLIRPEAPPPPPPPVPPQKVVKTPPPPPPPKPVVKQPEAPPPPEPKAITLPEPTPEPPAPKPEPVVVAPPPPEPPPPAPVAAPAPPPPAPATVVSEVPTVSDKMVSFARPAAPEYPAPSRRMGEEGEVVLRVFFNEDGRVEKIELHKSSGFQRLDNAAKAAAEKILLKPFVRDGKPSAVRVLIPFSFRMES